MLINLFAFKSELFKLRNVESIFPDAIWNAFIKVWNLSALLVPLMVVDDTGQIPTEVAVKVIAKYLEHLLESFSLTFHEHVHESFLNMTKLPAYPM